MSWNKESAAAGLGGLTPREVAVGVLMLEDFQYMNDPLPDPDAEYGELIKVIKVSRCNVVTLNLLKLCRTCRTLLLLYYICVSCSQRK